MTSKTQEYVLGTGEDELARLALQHRIWADAAVGAWKRAGIGPSSKVLDLGCGPGHAAFDMAQLVGTSGQVLAVDESPFFIQYLNSQSVARRLPQLSAIQADAQNLAASFGAASFDAVYCRWLLCWLPEPHKALAGIRKLLKPGGKIIIHDYFNWKAMTMAPRSAAIEKMVAAAVVSFTQRLGDVDICARIPALLRQEKFSIEHFDAYQRVARGGGLDSTIAWPLTWWRTYGPKLVNLALLSAADCQQALQDLNRLETDEDCFFFCPTLFEFIASPTK